MAEIPKVGRSDYAPLKDFPLRWRWTDIRWSQLPADALKDIQPLTKEKAAEICDYTLTFMSETGLVPDLFDKIEDITSAGDTDICQKWLRSLAVESETTVFVSWDPELAIVVSWNVFCTYWDDFCYPASDEVAIFPFSSEWFLRYDCAEVYTIGQRLG